MTPLARGPESNHSVHTASRCAASRQARPPLRPYSACQSSRAIDGSHHGAPFRRVDHHGPLARLLDAIPDVLHHDVVQLLQLHRYSRPVPWRLLVLLLVPLFTQLQPADPNAGASEKNPTREREEDKEIEILSFGFRTRGHSSWYRHRNRRCPTPHVWSCIFGNLVGQRPGT